MADIDDLFAPPNAGAYEKEELRKGPPLTYVGEKALRTALYHVHSLCRSARETAADSSLAEQGFLGELPVQDLSELSELIGRADAAFYYTLVSFLALYNFLGRLGDREEQEQKLQALRERGRDFFEDWLDSIESERSVTG